MNDIYEKNPCVKKITIWTGIKKIEIFRYEYIEYT